MRRPLAVITLALAVASCRTVRPPAGAPVQPVTASSAQAALDELFARRASFAGARSLMHVRATRNGQTQSFRALLTVDGSNRMQLVALTPLGTAAATIFADDGQVTFLNDIEGTYWQGSASDFARSFGFFGALSPADMAILLMGLPPSREGITYEPAPTGLARATAGDVTITFTPPVQPPKNVVVERGSQKLEIEHLDVASLTTPVTPPAIPAGYRCCYPPRL
jgi:hypothetical protein